MRKTRTATTLGFRLFVMLTLLLTGWFGAVFSPPSVAAIQDKPSLTYIALGDSYAAGYHLDGHEGSCDRSPKAYPYRVKDALNKTYNVDSSESHHLACTGATAGTNPAKSPEDLSISHQFETANSILDERARSGDKSPVLVTITIGANDLGLADPNTLRQVVRPSTILQPTVVASGGIVPGVPSIIFGPPQSGEDFFKWLDKKTAPIAPSLTTGIDSLLSHANVHIVLTDYPNPFRKGGFGACNDFYGSLSC